MAVFPAWGQAPAVSNAGAGLPRVALIGDSIRLGYAPVVARRLAGKATVISPAPNGGDSENVLRGLEEWAIREKPDVVLRQLVIRRYKPLPVPPSGPEAAAAYRKTEAERDAQVPAAYRNMRIGELRMPASAADWKQQRPDIRRIALESLGDPPPRPGRTLWGMFVRDDQVALDYLAGRRWTARGSARPA